MSDSDVESVASGNGKKRLQPITTTGRELLLSLVDQYKKVIESKTKDFGAIDGKRKAWELIGVKFSSHPGNQRHTGDQLKKTWDNLKSKAKKDVLEHKKKVRKTGGGPKPPDLPPSSRKIVEMIPDQMEPLENEFDCDAANDHVFSHDEFEEMETISEVFENPSSVPSTESTIETGTADRQVDTVINRKRAIGETLNPSRSTKPTEVKPDTDKGKRDKDPRSSLLDLEYEEHKIRLSTLAITQQNKRLKHARTMEMLELEHKEKMEVLQLKKSYYSKLLAKE